MSDAAVWEPPIVTTLRHYLHRRAPPSLLVRLAGGIANWRWLNATWNIEGRAYRSILLPKDGAALPFLGFDLCPEERRVALLQLAVDYVDAGELFPTSVDLGDHFGVSRCCIDNDLQSLRDGGRITVSLAGGDHGPRRVVRVVGKPGSTAAPRRAHG